MRAGAAPASPILSNKNFNYQKKKKWKKMTSAPWQIPNVCYIVV